MKVAVVGDASSYARALNKASGETASFGSSLAKLGKTAALVAGAAGLGALAVTLKVGISEWTDATKVAAQTGAVLKSTGGAANVTAKHVDDLATSILNYSGIDDEAVKSGENMLLTFTSIRNEIGKGNDIFDQATKAVTDMDVAMTHGNSTQESLSKTAILVGKALNDPVKGATALRRVGVQLTQQQQDQIKAFVKSGKIMEAQKIIVHELGREFGGSAKAIGDTLPGKLNILKESFKNLAGSMVGNLIPAFTKILTSFTGLIGRLSAAQGFKAKIVVAAQFVWHGLEAGVNTLRKEFSDLLFGSFQKGGGVGPEGIKFDRGSSRSIGRRYGKASPSICRSCSPRCILRFRTPTGTPSACRSARSSRRASSLPPTYPPNSLSSCI